MLTAELRELPAPLTPSDCDLRDFGWMPLDVTRLRDSDLAVLATGDGFRAAVLLWCAAWHQVPAASLPKDDRLLANLAGYGRDMQGWVAVRDEALRGFVECSDGRLYHPVVAEKALEAHDQRRRQQERTKNATDARRNVRRHDQRDGITEAKRNDRRHDHRDEARNVVQQTGQDQTKIRSKTSTEGAERESLTVERKPSLPRPDSLSQAPVPQKRALQGLKALGSPLPDDWTPDDELYEVVKREFGMRDDDIHTELLGFHAHHAQAGSYSANWRASFTTWCKRWKEHRDRQAPPRVQLNRSPRKGETTHEADQRPESLADIAIRHAREGISFGPKPTGLPTVAREPEGGDPVRLLSEW